MDAAHGFYWVGLSVATYQKSPREYVLVRSGVPVVGITTRSTNYDHFDTNGREFLVELYTADTLQISTGYPVSSTEHPKTGLTVFALSHLMFDDAVIFSVARDQTFSGHANPVPFNVENVNNGFHYDIFSHTFSAPSAGIYYFTFSVGLVAGGTANFDLHKNDEPFVNIYRTSTRHNGTDTIGRSIMMTLEADDTVHMVNNDNQVVWSSQLFQTSFSGFKYEPRHGNQVPVTKISHLPRFHEG